MLHNTTHSSKLHSIFLYYTQGTTQLVLLLLQYHHCVRLGKYHIIIDNNSIHNIVTITCIAVVLYYLHVMVRFTQLDYLVLSLHNLPT